MQLSFKYILALVVFLSLLLPQSGFVLHLKYCVELFPIENGMMCTPETMFQRSSTIDFSSPAISSSNPCCASKTIENKHRLKACIVETKPGQALELLAFPPSLSPMKIFSAPIDLPFDRHAHSPPISHLIIETSTLLI